MWCPPFPRVETLGCRFRPFWGFAAIYYLDETSLHVRRPFNMRSIFVAFGSVLCASCVFASGSKKKQDDVRVPFRLAIRHADPWMVKAMLEGQGPDSPELSTVLKASKGAAGGTKTGATRKRRIPLC